MNKQKNICWYHFQEIGSIVRRYKSDTVGKIMCEINIDYKSVVLKTCKYGVNNSHRQVIFETVKSKYHKFCCKSLTPNYHIESSHDMHLGWVCPYYLICNFHGAKKPKMVF